jgi:hypothetical protein
VNAKLCLLAAAGAGFLGEGGEDAELDGCHPHLGAPKSQAKVDDAIWSHIDHSGASQARRSEACCRAQRRA